MYPDVCVVAGCRSFCLALTSMSLAETRTDRGPHQYLNRLTSLPPHFCRGLLPSTPTSPACLLSALSSLRPSTYLLSIPLLPPTAGTSHALSTSFSGLYVRDCEMYSLFSFLCLSQCVLGFVTECYLLCLTTWCKVLDSLYFGCAEWVFGSCEIQHGNKPKAKSEFEIIPKLSGNTPWK